LRIPDETEITQAHELPAPPAAPPSPAAPPPAAPPPAGRPPGFVIADIWPWLGLLGVVVLAGLLVWLFVLRDRSHSTSRVPGVVGMQQQQAIPKLTGAGFNVKAIVGPSAKPRNLVVSQSPGAGARLAHGRTVTLHVSNGHSLSAPSPATTTAATTTTATTTAATTTTASAAVPSVTGEDDATAAGQVEAAGFVAETDPVAGSGTAGTVSAQTPPAGGQAPAGSVVRLSVVTGSSRPAKQVPDVVGQKAAAARGALLQAGLTAKTVYKQGKAASVGVVLAESPTGTQPAFTQITVTVGS